MKKTLAVVKLIGGIILLLVAVFFFTTIFPIGKVFDVVMSLICTIIPGVLGSLLIKSWQKDKRRFEQAIIDKATAYHSVDENTFDKYSEDGRLVLVKCPNCGASNKVREHSIGKCEYCGSPIQGPN